MMSRRSGRKTFLMGCILVLTACSGAVQTEEPEPPNPDTDIEPISTPIESTATPAPLDPMEDLLKNQLAANLGMEPGAVSVLSNSAVEFADSCLEVPMKDVRCAPIPVSGRLIVLQAEGLRYEYHVGSEGAIIQPATRALDWSRTGGPEGFCDHLTIFLSGEVYGTRCQADPDRVVTTLVDLLSPQEREQLRTWATELGALELDHSDPETAADRVERLLQFYGAGERSPAPSEEESLVLWVENVFRKMFP